MRLPIHYVNRRCRIIFDCPSKCFPKARMQYRVRVLGSFYIWRSVNYVHQTTDSSCVALCLRHLKGEGHSAKRMKQRTRKLKTDITRQAAKAVI